MRARTVGSRGFRAVVCATSHLRIVFMAGAITVASASVATAEPIAFPFTGTITRSGVPGTAGGDTVPIDVIADHGSSTTISRSSNIADIASANRSAGTQSATYTANFVGSNSIFRADTAGILTTVQFVGTGVSGVHSDMFRVGGSVRAVQDFLSRVAFFEPPQLTSLQNSSVTEMSMPIPEPATLTLLGVGLATAAVWLRKRRQATQSSSHPSASCHRARDRRQPRS